MPQSRARAIVALVAVNAMWGSSFPAMKCLNLEMDSHFGVTELTASTAFRMSSAAWVIALRFSLAFLIMLVFMRRRIAKIRLVHLASGAAIGSLFFLGLLLQVIGLATIPASRSGFLTSLAVVFTPMMSTLLGRRIPRISVLFSAAVAVLGVSILTGLITLGNGQLVLADDGLSRWTIGDSLTTLAALCFSGQILLLDRLGKRHDASAFTPSMFAIVALLAFLVFGVLFGRTPEEIVSPSIDWMTLATQPRFYGLIVVLCLFPSLLAFAWMNKYQPCLSAVQAAVIYTLEPVFASLWALFLPGLLSGVCYISYGNETFSDTLVVGGSLVLVANGLALWPESDRSNSG